MQVSESTTLTIRVPEFEELLSSYISDFFAYFVRFGSRNLVLWLMTGCRFRAPLEALLSVGVLKSIYISIAQRST